TQPSLPVAQVTASPAPLHTVPLPTPAQSVGAPGHLQSALPVAPLQLCIPTQDLRAVISRQPVLVFMAQVMTWPPLQTVPVTPAHSEGLLQEQDALGKLPVHCLPPGQGER